MRLAGTNRETELIEKLNAQNTEAFSQLYTLYVKKIYAYAFSIVKSPALAEDIVQETFIKLWENAAGVDPNRSIQAYLYAISRNLAINLLKKASWESSISEEILEYATQQSEDGLGYTMRRQTVEFIDLAINELPPKRKAIYELCHHEGYSYKQTAEKLGIKDTTVNSQMVKALKNIKDYMLRNGALLVLLFFRP